MGEGMTLIEKLLRQQIEPASEANLGDWEVGRLVLAPSFRTDVATLRHCLRLALDYAFEHGHVCRLFAACTHALSRLYRRFGFNTVARDVPLLGTTKFYTVICGTADEVRLGLSDRPSHIQ